MIALVLVAFMAVLGLLIMMGRLNLKRFLGYPNLVDIACTVFFLIIFAGTFSGMVVAGFASLFMSLMLWVLRATIGAERLELRWVPKRRGFIRYSVLEFHWTQIKPTECQPHWLVRMWKGPKA